MIEGVDFCIETSNKNEVCESCLAGKQSSKNFKSLQIPRSSRPLELVHSDVCGYMEETTFDGHRYFVTFTDDFSHFTVIYLLKRKSEVFEKFKEFEAMATAHFNQKLAKLRCDNGREYVGRDFQEFCKAKGVQLVLTVPYTPQQNGVSERINRTLMEKVRAMLYECDLPKSLWGEAVFCAAYLTNRSPTRALVDNKTPFEMWYGKKPDLSNLRIFGCNAYALVPKEKRQKLDPKTKKLIFAGYANNGYRLYNKSSRTVEIHRSVVFDEQELLDRRNDLLHSTISQPASQNTPVIESEPPAKSSEASENFVGNEDEHLVGNENVEDEPEVIVVDDEESIQEHHVGNVDESDYDSAQDLDSHTDGEGEVGSQPVPACSSPIRRSTRDRRAPEFYTAKIATDNSDVPQTVDQLKTRDDWPKWKIAISEELKALNENKTWKKVESLPKDRKSISSKWVFSIKEDGRYKARLVAKGCSQRPGYDYDETFAPVVKMESVRTILSLANQSGSTIHQMDVKTAFLNGQLEEEIYMRLPNDEMGNSQLVRLQKSLYGLKQASRSWNQRFDEVVKKLGFIPLKSDCCVYQSRARELTLVLYVDDILIVGKKVANLVWIKTELGRLFQMKDLKEVKHFLGMDFSRDYQKQTIEISQVGYTERILKRFGMFDSNPIGTPMDPNVQWTKTKDGETTNHPFKELLGCLQYLALSTRPDICAAVSALSKFQATPSDAHWAGLKRILRYLRGTTETKLVYTKGVENPALMGYADADFANDVDDRKSISGHAFKVFGNLVSWSTKRQQTVSLSSTEAELVSLCMATKEGMWLTNLLGELGVDNTDSFLIMEDNIPCIQFTEEPRGHQRMKHLNLKYMFIRELVKLRKVHIKHIRSEDQPADAKGLPKAQHRKLFEL